MRWFALILVCAVLSTVCGEPEPKKYKSTIKEKDKESNTSLTDEEKKFLREVEAKFGVKTDTLGDAKKSEEGKKQKDTQTEKNVKPPFPAVIAIEIVNDTDTKYNGKRTIDANLGYGYKTDHGYSYTYLGKSAQEKGKFMIYPYSQEDIPPARPNRFQSHYPSGHYTTSSPNVEIQPSKAYELVDVKDEQPSYHYRKPNENRLSYDNIKGLVSPPLSYATEHHQESVPSSTPTTLYSTYNGEQFSGLSGQFPMVMPNYFVDSSQLLKYPQFQSAGLSQDHLRTSGSPGGQKVVPVLVLRVPSSYLKNPTAELYPNLPQNYPLSQHLNHVNLQELVNNYFKKIGYNSAPQIKSYQNPLLHSIQTPVSTPVTHYEPQHYATPYIQPSYTQAEVSGVQYSAVKPVIAKYPMTYTRPQYYVSSHQHTYQQPAQQYEYTYQFVPKTPEQQTYYIQPQYQTSQQVQQVEQQQVQHEQVTSHHETSVQDTPHVEYGAPQKEGDASPVAPSVEYGTPETQSAPVQEPTQADTAAHYETPSTPTQEYGVPNGQNVQYVTQQTGSEYPTKVNLPVLYTTSAQAVQAIAAAYRAPNMKSTLAHYPSESGHIPRHYAQASAGAQSYAHATAQTYANAAAQTYTNAEPQQYYYQKESGEDSSNTLVLSENYPSKDHTIATVLPVSYKHGKQPQTNAVQTVSYVTPMPFSHKYQSPYRIMVPQTILKSPEKVQYVNSHSLPYNHEEHSSEAEYTVPSHFVPPVGKQKPPTYPRNYHAHPKRMVKPEIKGEMIVIKKIERIEKKSA